MCCFPGCVFFGGLLLGLVVAFVMSLRTRTTLCSCRDECRVFINALVRRVGFIICNDVSCFFFPSGRFQQSQPVDEATEQMGKSHTFNTTTFLYFCPTKTQSAQKFVRFFIRVRCCCVLFLRRAGCGSHGLAYYRLLRSITHSSLSCRYCQLHRRLIVIDSTLLLSPVLPDRRGYIPPFFRNAFEV